MNERRALTIIEIMKSVLASFFGVQSYANRVRDFTYGKPQQFIIVGLIIGITLILIIVTVVKLVLTLAGH